MFVATTFNKVENMLRGNLQWAPNNNKVLQCLVVSLDSCPIYTLCALQADIGYIKSLLYILDVSSPTWSTHRKHVFILSQSGKPVYSRYGSEEKLVNLFGIMQALVSIIEDGKDELRYSLFMLCILCPCLI